MSSRSSSSMDLSSGSSDVAGSRYPVMIYSRNSLLSLYDSPLVSAPPGLRNLKDWYGDYETPAHALHQHHTSPPNPRREPSNRRVPRHEGEQQESYGSMGDFKLPPNPSRRTRNPLETPPSSSKLGKSADQGTFRNRDGRSEDSGWRAKRDAQQQAQAAGRGVNIERKPAWMDESDGAMARSPVHWASPSSPVMMKDHIKASSPSTGGKLDEIQQFKKEMKAMEQKKQEVPSTKEVKANVQSSGIGLSRPTEHVDEIQKFKAEMKEMERRRKAASDKAEGKVDGTDKSEQKMAPPPGLSAVSTVKPATAPLSMYDDLRMPTKPSSASPSIPETTTRSASRFAKYFKAESSTTPTPPLPSPPQSTSPPSQAATDSNSLMAALMGSAQPKSAPQQNNQTSQQAQTQQARTSQAVPPGDEMARVLQMLHLSSQPVPASQPAQPPKSFAEAHPYPAYTSPPPHMQQQQQQARRGSPVSQRLPAHSIPGMLSGPPNQYPPTSHPMNYPPSTLPASNYPPTSGVYVQNGFYPPPPRYPQQQFMPGHRTQGSASGVMQGPPGQGASELMSLLSRGMR